MVSIFGVLGSLGGMRQYGDGPGPLIFWLIILFIPILGWLFAIPEVNKMKQAAAEKAKLEDDESIAGSINPNLEIEEDE